MSHFNLIDEKWIPLRFPDGRREELGLRDALLHAADVTEIEDPSPLVVAGLHRFLLAVLYRALEGPTDIEQARALFRDGLPKDRIEAYLDRWRDRFWLFHETHPFGQHPQVPEKNVETWTKLTAEFNPTSNKVLFDHTITTHPGAREPRECTRWLIATMSFSISGGRGYYPAPSSNAMMCIPLGRTLEQTFCYGLVPYAGKEVAAQDSALWERDLEPLPLTPPKRIVRGYADLYSWQPRLVMLERMESGAVTHVRFMAGWGCESTETLVDPMQPLKVHKKLGRIPIQFRADRPTWRDFDSLLPDAEGLAPQTVQHAVRLARGDVDQLPGAVLVLGLRYSPPNANVDFWRMERFRLPEALVGDRFIRQEVSQLLEDAQGAYDALYRACRTYARHLMAHGERQPTKEDIQHFISQLPALSEYWSAAEASFQDVLREYSLSRDPEDIRAHWLQSVRRTLRSVWQSLRTSVSSGDAWAIRALLKAEIGVLTKLKELGEEIAALEPKQEEVA